MRFKTVCVLVLLCGLWPAKASADNRFIIRTTLSPQMLQTACNPPLCTVVGGLGDPLGQLFLITSPLDLGGLLALLGNPLGIVRAEVDQLLNLFPVGSLNVLPSPLPADLMSDRTAVPYLDSGGSVWNSYANQPAAQIVRVSDAQSQFGVTGSGIVADIDTGVDPTHPALQSVLLPGYDFTRNQAGGSELTDLNPSDFRSYPPPACSSSTCQSPAQVNQSTAAVLDQSTAAVLDGNGNPTKYAAFGHGTMVLGIVHLVAPTAQLLPLKAFHSDGTANLSDILRAVYYAVQNNASVINMSFDTQTSSRELKTALSYATQNGVICVASAGNDGQSAPPLTVYPAEWQVNVMGVASTSDLDTRSSFSNYGNAIVWVSSPGEAIVTTYPFGTYAAGWGTSFSAPFVSGGSSLLINSQGNVNQARAARAMAHAVPLGAGMGHGRLDLVQALAAVPASDPPPAGSIDSPSGDVTILAGQSVFFSGSGSDPDGEITAYSWSFPGGEPEFSNVPTPGNVTYSSPGTFVVTFIVTDDSGINDPNPKTRTITVLPCILLCGLI